MRYWHHMRMAVLVLVAVGVVGCGVGLATGAAVVYYKTKGNDQTATVELKAQPDAVYRAAIAAAGKNPALTIVEQNDAERRLQFSKDGKTANVHVTELAPDATKLTISSSKAVEGENSATDLALQAVKRICDELKVQYKIVED